MPNKSPEPSNKQFIFLLIACAFTGSIFIWADGRPSKGNNLAKQAKREADQREVRHLTTCKNAIRKRAKMPDESDFEWDYDYTSDGITAMISGKVQFMNGFGVMIPHIYMCHFEGELLANSIAVEGHSFPQSKAK